jgi:hypothetical protein
VNVLCQNDPSYLAECSKEKEVREGRWCSDFEEDTRDAERDVALKKAWDEAPAAEVRLTAVGDDYYWLIDDCPYCHNNHFMAAGRADDTHAFFLGLREAPCRPASRARFKLEEKK